MSSRCKSMVKSYGRGKLRCSRSAIKDGLCKAHHPDWPYKKKSPQSELAALRSQVAELQKDVRVAKGQYQGACDIIAELQRKLDGYEQAEKQEPVVEVRDNPDDYGFVYEWISESVLPWPGLKLYRHPANLPAIIEQAKAEERERIGKLIHYPECWDTAAYPTLEDALAEINHCTVCENPEAHGYPKDWKQQSAAIRARKP